LSAEIPAIYAINPRAAQNETAKPPRRAKGIPPQRAGVDESAYILAIFFPQSNLFRKQIIGWFFAGRFFTWQVLYVIP